MISCPDVTIPLKVCSPPPLEYKQLPIVQGFKHICKLTITKDATEAIYSHYQLNNTWDVLACNSDQYILCCTVHVDGTVIGDNIERWCHETNPAEDIYQYDLDVPLEFIPKCNSLPYLLYILVGVIFLILFGIIFVHYSRVWIPSLDKCPWTFGRSYSLTQSDVSKNFITSRETEPMITNVHEIKIAPPRLTSDIVYCMNDRKAVILGEGRYGIVYKAMYGENFVAVKCTEREDKAEHEKIMFDLIGSRSDHLLRLTAYVSKHCDPFNRPTSIILVPAYLRGDMGTFLTEQSQKNGGIATHVALQLITTLACGIYELHRPSEGIENPLPCIAHRDLKPANVLISDKFESIICDFNSALPLIRELPHKCECFSRRVNTNVGHRPFEQYALLETDHHDHPTCQNYKILRQIDRIRDKCFDQKCPDGTWLYMAPEILSLKMFKVGEIMLSNHDIVNRYCSADIYSFSLIAWLVMSQCNENGSVPTPINGSIDDYLFSEFLAQSNPESVNSSPKTLVEKEQLMDSLVNREGIRPRCKDHPIYRLFQECWAAEGACRPDARQLYKRIKNCKPDNISSTTM